MNTKTSEEKVMNGEKWDLKKDERQLTSIESIDCQQKCKKEEHITNSRKHECF
jgi:hypothetical protein